MKSVIVFPEEMKTYDGLKTKGKFTIEHNDIHTGLVEEPDLTLNDCPEKENVVLVKKIAFSCNYRDKTILLNSDKFIKSEILKGNLHFTYLGSDFVGEVVEIGENVKDFNIGDKVIPNISYPSYNEDYKGGIATNYASSRIESFKANKLIKVPKDIDISDEILAGFPIAGFTAYSMIRKVTKPDAKVLVTAANSNTSITTIDALRNYPVKVYAMTSNPKHRDVLMRKGVEDVLTINHDLETYEDDETFMQKMDEIGGFDAVIDPFFDIYLPRIIDYLNMDAKYITCGLYNQYPDFDNGRYTYKGRPFSNILTQALTRNISIMGNCIGLKEDGVKALEDLINGKFNIEIDSVFLEGEEDLFFDRTYNAKDRLGKVIYKYKD
ncbi:alcohol dehydrogenase catalytic domain-containing protein [Flavobacteriaceae bacterium M23B6Z8]